MSRPPINDINDSTGLIHLGSIPAQAPVASFNAPAFENLIDTKGFRVIHYQHALLPDKTVLNGPVNPETQGASLRGVIYLTARELRSVPQSFKLEDRLTVQGLYGVGTVMMNVTGNYADNGRERAHISKRDLLVFPDVTDKTRQLAEFNLTGNTKFNYKIKGIEFLFDAKRQYAEGVDFSISNGEIAWLSGGVKPEAGSILSAVYWYTPIYIVQDLPHSLRIIPSNDFGHAAFPREATYAPQLLVLKPSTLLEENLLDWKELPPYPEYANTPNVTGG